MPRRYFVSNAVLWATAIIVSAILHAPPLLTTVLLPSLATTALLATWPKARAAAC